MFTSRRKAKRFALFCCLSLAKGIAVIASKASTPANSFIYKELSSDPSRNSTDNGPENNKINKVKPAVLIMIDSKLVE